jgi:AcrR family transcriptional regulator
MRNLTKGQLSKQKIIREARDVFNRKGSQITVQELAMELGQGVSYITNHYRTKDHLIVAIAVEYEEKFYEILGQLNKGFNSLDQLAVLVSSVMDLQYEYRCALLSVVASSSNQKVLFKQVKDSYRKNISNFSDFIRLLVTNGILKEEILGKEELAIIRFQYVNLHTTWVVSLELYDHPNSYKKMKPLYLKGILNCFLPYLTLKGSRQYRLIDFKGFR